MIASTATAVLPVWRSPMISSRWPRPIGTIASMAFSPVCSGSLTGWRSTTPGARRSIGMNCFVAIGPLPSIGWPSALTTRPSSSSPTGTEMMRPVRLTVSPSLMSVECAEQHGADAVLFEVQRDAEHAVRELEHLAGHGALDAVDAGDAVADRHDGADFGHVDVHGVVADLVADDFGNLFGLDLHADPSVSLLAGPASETARRRRTRASSTRIPSNNRRRIRSSCRATLPSNTMLPTRATTPPDDRGIDPRR